MLLGWQKSGRALIGSKPHHNRNKIPSPRPHCRKHNVPTRYKNRRFHQLAVHLHKSNSSFLGLTDAVLSQVHLTHSASVEFLRQFWITYLSTSTRSSARKKELASLVASLKRAVERMEAVRAFAVKEGGEIAGETVRGVLLSVKGSVDKAVALWERGDSG